MPLVDTDCANATFVQAVEELPVLYNYNLKEYSNRHEQDKAWRELAEMFNATETECKHKWKNIRGGFTRYIKSLNTTGSSVKKPYYLWDTLQFLIPYLKSRSQPGNIPETETHKNQQEPEDNEEDDDNNQNTPAENQPPQSAIDWRTPDNIAPSASFSSCRSTKAKRRKIDPLEKAVTMYLKNKGGDTNESNPDLDFFKSILPDIANFTPLKKRQFKRKVLDLIDELSEANNPPQTN